jgi:hypothetical protein
MPDLKDLRELTLPEYVKRDIDALKEGIQNGSTVLDCLWCELYGSINTAYWDREISFEDAAYLRKKYLGLEVE